MKGSKSSGVQQYVCQECNFVEAKHLLMRRDDFESKEERFPQQTRGRQVFP